MDKKCFIKSDGNNDYFYSDNEGHMFSKITNDTNEEKTIDIAPGEGFMQGIFVEYGITVDDDVTDARNGGFGSTTKQKEQNLTWL